MSVENLQALIDSTIKHYKTAGYIEVLKELIPIADTGYAIRTLGRMKHILHMHLKGNPRIVYHHINFCEVCREEHPKEVIILINMFPHLAQK